MDLEAAIVLWLQDLATVRTHPLPDGPDLPAITYLLVSDVGTGRTNTGPGPRRARYQLVCHAERHADARALALAIQGRAERDVDLARLCGAMDVQPGTLRDYSKTEGGWYQYGIDVLITY
jgi:hypothetical protein